ncbi:MAG: hypothetical protein ABW224_26160 [Kibdelosporangium sp.]
MLIALSGRADAMFPDADFHIPAGHPGLVPAWLGTVLTRERTTAKYAETEAGP